MYSDNFSNLIAVFHVSGKVLLSRFNKYFGKPFGEGKLIINDRNIFSKLLINV
jgi:hypothetical protein